MAGVPRLAVWDRRRAGVLLPLSALEAPLGRGGRAFLDWLATAGFTLWQVLPLGPTGADGSPYWVSSDEAGNPALLDPGELPAPQGARYARFLEENAAWLEEFALFQTLSQAHSGAPFWRWPAALRAREAGALAAARRELAAELERVRHEQYAFSVQWQQLRAHAHERGVRLCGDLPFYVAPSSLATWTQRELFQLAPDGSPAAVGGVPPDYFSALGQMWGNPLYDWEALARSDYRFWVQRVGAQLERLDLLRLDHFRALAAHWAVPAGASDARAGAWRPTPGAALLTTLRRTFPDLPLIAEDLGVITPEVEELLARFQLPGMRVLQFAFDGGDNPHLPHRHVRACVVYTGTHDNDTTRGWYDALEPATALRADRYLGVPADAQPGALIRAALASVADLAVIPAQDLLGLPSSARLNTPGTASGNWRWRLPPGALTPALAAHFAQLNALYGR
ncbi:MAG: 4-alpha-glucanotransferase [Gammaproteobacteria bacterium]|nr:4-alpha-glucanotransferase [Gammaproteobacteria bacterium]